MKKLDDLLNPRKIIPFYIERKDLFQKELPPVAVELHWTSNCNYDCLHCSYGSRRKTKGYLSNDIVNKLIEDLIDVGCKAVYLSGGGEPTVMKGWERHAEKLMNNGVEVALITNGIAIKDDFLNVVRRMNYVAVSVYSTYEDRYQNITGSRFFDKQFAFPEKIRSRSSSAVLGARCVLNEHNYDEVYEIYEKTIGSGFDYIIFIPAVDYEDSGLSLDQDKVDSIIESISSDYDRFDHDKTNVVKLIEKSVLHYKGGGYRENIDVPMNGCKSVQIRSNAFVNYDGGVYLCQPDIGDKRYEIGNLNDSDFIEIWNSDGHSRVQQLIEDRYDGGACVNCRSIALNDAVYKYESSKKDELVEIDVDYFL